MTAGTAKTCDSYRWNPRKYVTSRTRVTTAEFLCKLQQKYLLHLITSAKRVCRIITKQMLPISRARSVFFRMWIPNVCVTHGGSRERKHIYYHNSNDMSTPIIQFKVSKGAKIRNRYNQVPHLTQDANWKVTNSQLDTTNEGQEMGQSYYPRTPQDTPGHPRTHKTLKDTFIWSILLWLWIKLRFIFIECVIKLNISIQKYWVRFVSVWIVNRLPQNTSIYHRTSWIPKR